MTAAVRARRCYVLRASSAADIEMAGRSLQVATRASRLTKRLPLGAVQFPNVPGVAFATCTTRAWHAEIPVDFGASTSRR